MLGIDLFLSHYKRALCPGALVWIIYKNGKLAQGSTASGKLWPVARAIAESGALYTIAAVAHLVAFLTGSNGQFCSLSVLTPLIVSLLTLLFIDFHTDFFSTVGQGITFCLIFFRVYYHQGDTVELTTRSSTLRFADTQPHETTLCEPDQSRS